MYKTLNEHNNEVDYKRLDVIAPTNAVAKDRQYSEMVNLLRKCGNMFSFVSEAKIAQIAQMIQEKGFGCVGLEKAVDKIIETQEKFPPYKYVLELVRLNTPATKLKTSEYDLYKDSEDKDLTKIKEKFIELLGEDKLALYVKWWLKNCYTDLDADMLVHYNIATSSFERPALFDWHDTGYTSKFNRIVDTFNKKLPEQIKRKNKANNRDYKRLVVNNKS